MAKNFIGNATSENILGTLENDFLNGLGGNDSIHSSAGDDVVFGGEGNDEILGGMGNDSLEGEEGNDRIEGGAGEDTIIGGAGEDTIIGGADADILFGGVGNDSINGNGGNDTIKGEAGNDTLIGSAEMDIIHGGEDDDSIKGNNGDDFLTGDNGSDFIEGGEGNDSILGNTGNDFLLGNNGDDAIAGGAGDDTINSGEGNDLVYGDNYISGTQVVLGNNLIVNGSFENHGELTENNGTSDELDSLEGWTTNADDGMEIKEQAFKYGAAADGNAWLELDSDSNQISQHVDTQAGEQYQISFEYSPRKGTTAESNKIEIYWNGEIIGTIAKGGADANTWKTHTYMVQADSDNATGLEFRYAGNGSGKGAFIDDVKVQQVVDEPLADQFGTDATFGNDVINAGDGNDTVYGNQGNDTIKGGTGDDSIRANAGDDLLEGNEGKDFIDGQAGNDTVLGGDGDDYLKGGAGNDLVEGGAGNDGIWGGAGDDNLKGGTGDDLIDDTRGGDDCLWGGDGNDTLYAGDDNDVVSGGHGEDKLFGDKGNDTVIGGADNDTVNGGQGNDLLYGDNLVAETTFGDNLVVNGSFENNSVHNGCRGVFQSIEGWTTTFGSGIEIKEQASRYGAAADGDAWVELDSYSNSGMIQNIGTVAGEQYQLSFDYKPRQCVSSNSNGIQVYWNGELLDTITKSGYHSGNLSWKTYTYTVDANVNLTDLEFRAVGYSDYKGGFIDDVNVRQIFQTESSDKFSTDTVVGCDRINGGDGNDTVIGGAGADTVFGGAGDDVLNGTDSVNAGFNQEDRLNGGLGKDTFVLGDANNTYYNDRGWTDCVVVEDLNTQEDTVQLHGSSNDYWLSSSSNGNSYLWEWNGNNWDGIAMFENTQLDNSHLDSEIFEYV